MSIKSKVDAIYALEALKRPHYEAGDPFYNCQKTADFKAFAAKQMNVSIFKCTCGADKDNARIEEIIAFVKTMRTYNYKPKSK